jgi:hypothetical protein
MTMSLSPIDVLCTVLRATESAFQYAFVDGPLSGRIGWFSVGRGSHAGTSS